MLIWKVLTGGLKYREGGGGLGSFGKVPKLVRFFSSVQLPLVEPPHIFCVQIKSIFLPFCKNVTPVTNIKGVILAIFKQKKSTGRFEPWILRSQAKIRNVGLGQRPPQF